MDEKIRVLFIFEILGRPPEHIKKTLEEIVIGKLEQIKGIEIIKKEIHEPKPLEDEKAKQKGLFTTFAEVEISCDNLSLVFDIVLNMLPAHVEVLGPDELRLKNFDLSTSLSALTMKIHRYDEVAKALMMERNKMIKKVEEMEETIKELEKVKKGKTKKKKEGKDKEKEDKEKEDKEKAKKK